MKLRTNFFILARVILIMSAPSIISGTSAVAATIASTSVAVAQSDVAQNSITVNNYLGMLQSLTLENQDQVFYDAASMSDQILCNVDEQGNRSYEAVANKAEETMENLTTADTTCYQAWLENESPVMKASSYKVASPDKITTSTAATLALTLNQVNQVNQTLGTITHSPLANNIFDQQAIVAAIVSYLASLGLGASASTISTVAAVTKYGAGALLAIAAIPIISEFIGHAIEGRARAHYAAEGDRKKSSILDLNKKEKMNEEIATASKKIADANHESTPMVYGYMSPTAEAFGRFATNWRNGWAPIFNMIGFNITSDELHISNKQMDNISEELDKQKEQAEQITAVISSLQSQARRLSSIEGGASVLDKQQTLEKTTIASLQAKQTSCIVRGIKYVSNGISSFVSDKVKALDEKWENFQIGIRNGGVVADDEIGVLSSLHEVRLNHRTSPSDTRMQGQGISSSYSYQAVSTDPSGRGFNIYDTVSGRAASDNNASGRDPKTITGGASNDKKHWERK